LIAFGTGGIKPCVASFGGEQFKLPEQQEAMSTYFSLFYAAINSGSLISTILTPLLRQKVSCANEDTWYESKIQGCATYIIIKSYLQLSSSIWCSSSPHGRFHMYAKLILFPCEIIFNPFMDDFPVIFWGGSVFKLYKILDPKENIIVKTSKCIWVYWQFNKFILKLKIHQVIFSKESIVAWRKDRKSGERKESILDYSETKYGKSFIDDVKALKSVTYMFLPFPIFWALFDQQVEH